jgi:hypothetical protein
VCVCCRGGGGGWRGGAGPERHEGAVPHGVCARAWRAQVASCTTSAALVRMPPAAAEPAGALAAAASA